MSDKNYYYYLFLVALAIAMFALSFQSVHAVFFDQAKVIGLPIGIANFVPYDWQTRGDIEIDEDGIIKIGNNISENYYFENYISQNTDKVANNLVFKYKLESSEDLEGFDEQAFVLEIDNKKVFELSYLDSINWAEYTVNLDQFNTEYLEIKFMAGNSGDRLKPSWVYIKEIGFSD